MHQPEGVLLFWLGLLDVSQGGLDRLLVLPQAHGVAQNLEKDSGGHRRGRRARSVPETFPVLKHHGVAHHLAQLAQGLELRPARNVARGVVRRRSRRLRLDCRTEEVPLLGVKAGPSGATFGTFETLFPIITIFTLAPGTKVVARLWHPWAMVWFLDTRIVFINQSINRSTRRRRRRRAQSTGVALLPLSLSLFWEALFTFPLSVFWPGGGLCRKRV